MRLSQNLRQLVCHALPLSNIQQNAIVLLMKVMKHCYNCLRGLAEKTVRLSGDSKGILRDCYDMIEKLWDNEGTPPAIANKLLKYIKEETGVYDPYASIKEEEFQKAAQAMRGLSERFPDSLEGALKLSAIGNSLDFFIEDEYDISNFFFSGDVDKIKEEVYTKSKDVLILGDNIGDFVFDRKLIEYLQREGKTVYYAVKEHPVQNDLSIQDVMKYNFKKIFGNIISTGTDEVGIKRQDMIGKVKSLWESDGIVIAKGMGNYETLSENEHQRSVIHIMKVKCIPVGASVQKDKGTYIALHRR